MAEAVEKPPTSELGGVASFNSYFLSWGAFVDTRESTQELMWPTSRDTYDLMFNDAQVRGLLMSMVLPITRYRWFLDPKGARPEIVQALAEDLGLPILGMSQEEQVARRRRNKNRFSHHKHLEQTLTMSLKYGFMMYEQVAEIREGMARLKKLGPRMPHTIDNINVEKDGGLKSIEQPGNGHFQKIEIPVGRLVAYVWDQEPGHWVGRSMLRSMYKAWLIKDRVIRVGAINIERAGAGIPIIEAPPGATKEQIAALGLMATKFKAGEASGGAVPNGSKLQLPGVQGTQPDAAGYIRLMNEEMARSSLQMFMQLGQTETGSRALGEEFIDYFALAQQATAKWYADITNEHVVEDWVDWNFGEDELAPEIVFIADEDPDTSVTELRDLIESGAVTVDTELENWVRSKRSMPSKPEASAPVGQSYGYDLDNGIITIDERRAQVGLEPREDGLGKLTVPEFLATIGGTETDALGIQNTATAPRESDASVRQAAKTRERLINRLARAVRARLVAEEGIPLPDRKLRRKPNAHELKAKVDFKKLDDDWNASTAAIVEAWKDIRADQIDDLYDQIIKADGDLDELAGIEAPALGSDELYAEMVALAESGRDAALQEAKDQGKSIKAPAIDKEFLRDRSDAVSSIMARSLGEAAARNALNRTGGSLTAKQVAQEVKDHLLGLSDAYLKDTLGGALTNAQNTGRFTVAEEIGDDEIETVVASELLDGATCDACVDVDETEYESLAALMEDYPMGQYKDCKGGTRCRGTGVIVYKEDRS